MKIELENGLILCSLTLSYRGNEMTINNLILDTGASETLIYRHAVQDLDIHLEDDDEFVFMRGIGGREMAIRKKVTLIRFGGFNALHFPIDFGDSEIDSGINGLLGLDILTAGKFVIDLSKMEVHQKPQ